MPCDGAISFSDLTWRRGGWAGHNNLKRILSLVHPLCGARGETVVFVRHLNLAALSSGSLSCCAS